MDARRFEIRRSSFGLPCNAPYAPGTSAHRPRPPRAMSPVGKGKPGTHTLHPGGRLSPPGPPTELFSGSNHPGPCLPHHYDPQLPP